MFIYTTGLALRKVGAWTSDVTIDLAQKKFSTGCTYYLTFLSCAEGRACHNFLPSCNKGLHKHHVAYRVQHCSNNVRLIIVSLNHLQK